MLFLFGLFKSVCSSQFGVSFNENLVVICDSITGLKVDDACDVLKDSI